MPLLASEGSTIKSEPIPAGSYVARCYSLIEIGTESFTYMGEEKSVHKLRLTWELATEMKVFKEEIGEQPLVVSEEFTLSLSEKSKLRPFLESWRGKQFTAQELMGFDLESIVGVPCMLNIIHSESKKGTKFATIASISPVPKGISCPPQINAKQVLTYAEWNQETFDSLPDFMREKIMKTPEYQEMTTPSEKEPVTDEEINIDDIPF